MRSALSAATSVVVALSACTATATDQASPAAVEPGTAAASGFESPTSSLLSGVATEPSERAPVSTSPSDSVSLTLAPVIAVQSAPVAVEVTSAIISAGGELATTQQWQRRFGVSGIPIVNGDGVQLVEAELDALLVDGRWQRVDALQWLFADRSGSTVEDYLDDVAHQAGLSAPPVVTSERVDGADCIARTYADGDRDWLVQGCAFARFGSMMSVGVLRSDSNGMPPPSIGPSTESVRAAIGGAVRQVTVTFGSPAPSSTSTLIGVVEIDTVLDASEVAARLEGDALDGWIVEVGEGSSVVFAGSPGSTWTVTGDTTRFTSEGRLNP